MPLLVRDVSVFVALGHGLLAFFSPCVLPLIPVFLGIVLSTKGGFLKILGFFLGLTVFFSLLGAVFGGIGAVIPKFVLNVAAGLLVLLFGFFFAFDVTLFKVKRGVNLWKFKGSQGFLSGFLLGASVGLVWTPCSSPVLASILAIATTTGSVLKGAVLLFFYSLGIAIPLLALGGVLGKFLERRVLGSPTWYKLLKVVGSSLLILVGILILSGRFITY